MISLLHRKRLHGIWCLPFYLLYVLPPGFKRYTGQINVESVCCAVVESNRLAVGESFRGLWRLDVGSTICGHPLFITMGIASYWSHWQNSPAGKLIVEPWTLNCDSPCDYFSFFLGGPLNWSEERLTSSWSSSLLLFCFSSRWILSRHSYFSMTFRTRRVSWCPVRRYSRTMCFAASYFIPSILAAIDVWTPWSTTSWTRSSLVWESVILYSRLGASSAEELPLPNSVLLRTFED